MANEKKSFEIWEWTDQWKDTATFEYDSDGVLTVLANETGGVVFPPEAVRELRDFLTAKLEGNDGFTN